MRRNISMKKERENTVPARDIFTCPICGISFHSISILKVHVKEIHGKDIDTIALPIQGEEYSHLESHISPL